ncbi:hypothetical protein ACFL16_03500, partial [Patescibacteria group bacterium]
IFFYIMFNYPDPQTKDPKERKIQRFLEMIPGILTWSTIIGMPLLSFFCSDLGGFVCDRF